MGKWWKDLDRILRGDATQGATLGRGAIDVPVGGISILLVILGMVYGICMGCFSIGKFPGYPFHQLLSATLKVPLLFVMTLVVTFPSLYVFNALVGSRLSLASVLRLLVASMAVMVTVLASMGTIVAFFSFSTTSYPFMVLINVVVFAVSGTFGLIFLLRTLQRLSVASAVGVPEVNRPVTGALEPLEGQVLGRNVKAVFRCWVVLFGLVGAQMGWVLRPFIGRPELPFVWIRGRESNFFQGVMHALASLFS